MKKIIVFGISSLLFAILGAYILKYTNASNIYGILSLIVAILFAILCICKVFAIGNSGSSANIKLGLILLLVCDVLLVTVSIVCLIQKADIFQTIGWIFAFCCMTAYIVISYRKK